MKNKLFNIAYNKITLSIFTALALIVPMLNYAFRFGYVYIDNTLFKGFSLALFIVMVLNAVFLFTAAVLKMKKSEVINKTLFSVGYLISLILTIVFSIVVFVNMIVSGSESTRAALFMLQDIFPIWLAIVSVMFFAFIFPAFKNNTFKKSISVVTAICLIAVFVISIFPVTPYKFTSNPVVFDNGKSYSVVFSTNDSGTAYIDYNYDGKDYRVYDEDNGRKNADGVIHTIEVPYDHLNNNSYKVASTRVIDELSYGGRSGKTIETDAVNFKGTYGDKIDVLTISDWHTYNDMAKQSIEKVGNYDAVIMLGDSCAGISYEEEIVRNILTFGGDITNGTMPIIFARGNHETRGKMAGKLSDYLGMDKFYYKTSLGKYDLIVLDSGEDKKDDHSEYGGMVNYEKFRKDMVNWLETLENTNNKKTIALSHSDEICIEEDLALTAKQKLSELNISLLASGHTHEAEYKKGTDYPTFINGGKGKKAYIASKISLSDDGISMVSYDDNGTKIIEENTAWK